MIGPTNRQTDITTLYIYFINQLGNPALTRIFRIKFNPINLESLNPWFYRVSQSTFEANRSRSSRVMSRHPNTLANRDFFFIYTKISFAEFCSSFIFLAAQQFFILSNTTCLRTRKLWKSKDDFFTLNSPMTMRHSKLVKIFALYQHKIQFCGIVLMSSF